MAIQWARILLIFRVNSFVGPMLNIIQSMLVEVGKFIMIYFIVVLIFESSGRILFISVDEFKSESDAWLTLFSATLGSFKFSIFESDKMHLSKEYGYYFLILYLLVTNIVLLNFIIAILSNTYTKLRDINKTLYYAEIIKARNVFEYDRYYSSMIALPIPLNALFLPVLPFVIFMKSRKLNTVLMHIAYIPLLIVGVLVFTVISIVLLPFSYIALLYQNFIDIWEKGANGSVWTEF